MGQGRSIARRLTDQGPPMTTLRLSDLWLAPHRPLFLAAALWSVLALAWWQWGISAGLPSPSLGTPTLWHAHEMLTGFGGASMAAYFLTAVTGWTGRPPTTGRLLQVVVALWFLERIAMVRAEALPLPLLLLPGIGYFGLVAALLIHDIFCARVWGKLGFPAAVLGLGLADLLFVLEAREGATPFDSATLTRALWMFFAIKVSVIGGKMLPAFSGNWLKLVGHDRLPHPSLLADRLGLALLFIALGLTLAGSETASAVTLLVAAPLQLWRLVLWTRLPALRNPLLAMLHATFLWLPVGLALVGLARLVPDVLREADVVHALTMGAMGGMILSIAARAAARRDGPALRAGSLLILAYALIWLATWARLAVGVLPQHYLPLVEQAAGLWTAGWVVFLAAFLPTAVGPVLRPIFSGPRA